jgi:hypothetical protein
MTAQELLATAGIPLKSTRPGNHYTTCPQCSAKRSKAHQSLKVLGVKIDERGATWHCNHCGWSGPQKGNKGGNGRARDNSAATYDYVDTDGVVRFQKVRNPPGSKLRFWMRRPDGNGGWIKGTEGVDTTILYRLPEVIEAIALVERTILVVEGEKDVDNLWRIGIPATCNAGGASAPDKLPKWRREHSAQLVSADIVVIPDHDPAGYAHADATCRGLLGVAKRVRMLVLAEHWPDIPEKGDVSDWLAAGHTREQLDALIEQAPDYRPASDADVGAAGDDFGRDDVGGDGHDGVQNDELVTTEAADLEMRGIDWLWPGRFARGKFGLIAGLPDMGKGQIAAFITAAVTAGIELPCGEGAAPQGDVIWFNAEDGARDTVLPRLVAAGADLKRVHFVNGARVGGEDKTFSLVTDLRLLRKKILQIGNVVLVIIDPVSAYLGVGKVDGRSATDVRGVLTPLKDMAEELHIAVIGIAHFNKKDDVKSALLRVSDSIAYVAAARHVYAVLDDPEDKERKLFVKAKNNLAPDKKALRYGMGVKTVGHDARLGVDIEAPFIVWHPQHVEITANEAMQAAGGHTAKREAREFLLERLEAGPVNSDDIIEEATQEGIAKRTLDRAKKDLGVRSRKQHGAMHGIWLWELPPKKARHAP